MRDKQRLTTILILIQQASLLRGLGSFNRRSECLELSRQFIPSQQLEMVFRILETYSGQLELTDLCQACHPASNFRRSGLLLSATHCRAGCNGTRGGCAALDKKARAGGMLRLVPIPSLPERESLLLAMGHHIAPLQEEQREERLRVLFGRNLLGLHPSFPFWWLSTSWPTPWLHGDPSQILAEPLAKGP